VDPRFPPAFARGDDEKEGFRDTRESGNLCATRAPIWMPVFTGMTGSYDVKQKMCRIMRRTRESSTERLCAWIPAFRGDDE
jgi:hypothetical protein